VDDHVVPLAQGGTDAFGNHAGACVTCHNEKSAREALVGRGLA
jgi:5-methylcytosine-specific restriction endonuclease McrA